MHQVSKSESYANKFEKLIVWETYWKPYARKLKKFIEPYTNMQVWETVRRKS